MSAITLVFLFLSIICVFVIAAVVIGREARRLDAVAPRVVYEIEVAARKCEKHFARLFPLTHAAWNKNGRIAP